MKNKKPLWITIFIICVLAAAAGILFLINPFGSGDVSRGDFTPTQTETAAAEPTAAQTEAPAETAASKELFSKDFGFTLAELGDFDVDFDELKAINRDIYAWIYIPNTKVDYPVVRSVSDGNDAFYLEHNIYRQYQFSGSIYSELENHPDFHDPVTVLYGHNMLNGSMFATLHNFENADFFEKNHTAFIITKDRIYTYLIYAAYSYDNRHILYSNDFSDPDVFSEYLDSTLHPYSTNKNVRDGVELSTDDHILVLSTCTNGASDARYLVQGVLAIEQER